LDVNPSGSDPGGGGSYVNPPGRDPGGVGSYVNPPGCDPGGAGRDVNPPGCDPGGEDCDRIDDDDDNTNPKRQTTSSQKTQKCGLPHSRLVVFNNGADRHQDAKWKSALWRSLQVKSTYMLQHNITFDMYA
jgi:hypothetical protein